MSEQLQTCLHYSKAEERPVKKEWLIGGTVGVGIVTYVMTKRKQKKARIQNRHIPYGPYEAIFKRPFDIILSGTALIILSPVMAVTALMVRIRLGKPVIFKQERTGLNEGTFIIRKFRTMLDGGGSDEERLTDFGRKLRSTSIDELPELLNIVKGDMAIVGPRPLLIEYLPRYNERQRSRHDVRPGLTSLSASKERNLASWEHKFEDDVAYVNHVTFLGDCKIILDTLKIVLKREGIHSKTSETMERFLGNGRSEKG